jgi:hypothetical protein
MMLPWRLRLLGRHIVKESHAVTLTPVLAVRNWLFSRYFLAVFRGIPESNFDPAVLPQLST